MCVLMVCVYNCVLCNMYCVIIVYIFVCVLWFSNEMSLKSCENTECHVLCVCVALIVI